VGGAPSRFIFSSSSKSRSKRREATIADDVVDWKDRFS
jgi:hypothetical protein